MNNKIIATAIVLGSLFSSPLYADAAPVQGQGVAQEAIHDFRGNWIGIDRLLPGEEMINKTRVNARYLRGEFKLQGKTVKEARLYIATMGYYETFINGQHIDSEHVLKPIQSDFRKSITYDEHDVTAVLQNVKGSDLAIGVILGNGRTVPMRYLKHYKCPFFGFPKVNLDLVVTYTDGSKQVISSAPKGWKAMAEGPIGSNNEYDGEVYDANREMAGWALPGFDDSTWRDAERTELPIADLHPQMTPNQTVWTADRIKERGDMLKVKRVKGNIFDVQQNMAGWIALKVKGNKGDTIRIKYAERLNPDSTLYIANLRDAETQDVYICSGKEGDNTWWRPTFVYHGFRYVQVTGGEAVNEASIKPELVSNDIATIGSFVSSNRMLNRIYQNAWWGIIDNYKGFPVDCPQRNERQPWLGDRTVGSLGESYLFDNNTLYTRWMRDICDSQNQQGVFSDVAPAFWNYYNDDVTWPACLPFTCEMLYEQFGNDTAIRQSYPYIKKWIQHLMSSYLKDGIITKDKYGDWCMPPEKPELIHSQDPARQTDGALLSTAYMIRILQQMSRFADLQGFTEESKDWAKKSEDMTVAFNKKFLHINRGTSQVPGHPLYPDSIFYGGNTATANVVALAFNLVPEDCKQAVIDNVVKSIITDNGGHVSCGVIGISYLLRTLTANGYGDVAYLIATNSSFPSWGYMAENGATTIWELWNGDTANPAMNSGNHVMLLGDLLTWCYQDLAGIKNAPGSIAYKKLLMKPDFTIQDLDSINCSYMTPQGMVTSKWTKTLNKLHWEVTLPSGVTADCVMPDGTVKQIAKSTVFDVPMAMAHKSIISDEFVYDQSIYPETHSASIVELKDGTLLATYFGGTKERNPDVCIFTQRKENGKWAKPVLAVEGIFDPASEDAKHAGLSGIDSTDIHNSIHWMKKTAAELAEPLTPGLRAVHLKGDGDEYRKACWNPVLFEMPDGTVYLYYKVGRAVADWTGWVTKSTDGGKTWSKGEPLPDGFLGPIKNKPILLGDKLLCPTSTEVGGWRLHVEILDTKTGKWTMHTPPVASTAPAPVPEALASGSTAPSDPEAPAIIPSPSASALPAIGAIQPSILIHNETTLPAAALAHGKAKPGIPVLQLVARTRPTEAMRKGKDMVSRGKVATSWSFDGGETWSEVELIDVPQNQSGLDAVTLSKPAKVVVDGDAYGPSDAKEYKKGKTVTANHVLIYNNFATLPLTGKGPRTPLSLAVSEDGVKWYHWMTLEDSPISQYSYPSIIQGRDGTIHCIYTWRRQRIAYKAVMLK